MNKKKIDIFSIRSVDNTRAMLSGKSKSGNKLTKKEVDALWGIAKKCTIYVWTDGVETVEYDRTAIRNPDGVIKVELSDLFDFDFEDSHVSIQRGRIYRENDISQIKDKFKTVYRDFLKSLSLYQE